MNRKTTALWAGGTVLAFLVGIGAAGCDSDESAATTAGSPAATSRKPAPTKVAPPEPATETPTREEAPVFELTTSQEQAVGTAEDYLNYTPFSRSGLIEQLKYEGFSTADAKFAVDHISVDWNEQAAQSARDYLDYSHFSRAGLIDQLEYEGFTHDQAVYGVDKAGL